MSKNLQRGRIDWLMIVTLCAVIGVLLFACFSFAKAEQVREAQLKKDLQPEADNVSQLVSLHAQQMATPNKVYTVTDVADVSGGKVIRLVDNAQPPHSGELFVPNDDRYNDLVKKIFSKNARLFFTLKAKPEAVTYQNYRNFFVFDLLDVHLVKQGDIPPVPEPATVAALGLGLAGLLAKRRRRRPT